MSDKKKKVRRKLEMLASGHSPAHTRRIKMTPAGRCLIYRRTLALLSTIIAELAERSPIIIQNNNNPSSRKNLDVRPYDRMTAQGATFDMRGQMYRGHAKTTALFSSPVISGLGSESDGARRCALETCGKKKCELRF